MEVVQFKCDIVTDAWQLGVLEPELGHLCCLDEQAGKIKEAQVQRLEHQADEIDILKPHNNKQTKFLSPIIWLLSTLKQLAKLVYARGT